MSAMHLQVFAGDGRWSARRCPLTRHDCWLKMWWADLTRPRKARATAIALAPESAAQSRSPDLDWMPNFVLRATGLSPLHHQAILAGCISEGQLQLVRPADLTLTVRIAPSRLRCWSLAFLAMCRMQFVVAGPWFPLAWTPNARFGPCRSSPQLSAIGATFTNALTDLGTEISRLL